MGVFVNSKIKPDFVLFKSAAQGHTAAQTELDILDQLDAQ